MHELGVSMNAARLGDPTVVEAETITHDSTDALVTVRLSSGKSSDAISLVLLFESGWKIKRLRWSDPQAESA